MRHMVLVCWQQPLRRQQRPLFIERRAAQHRDTAEAGGRKNTLGYYGDGCGGWTRLRSDLLAVLATAPVAKVKDGTGPLILLFACRLGPLCRLLLITMRLGG